MNLEMLEMVRFAVEIGDIGRDGDPFLANTCQEQKEG